MDKEMSYAVEIAKMEETVKDFEREISLVSEEHARI